jgi:CO dehydrogenase maturation factor
LIGELVSAQHQVTIVDMEAGLEHFSRSGGTLRYVDQLFIVAEPDHKALETARRTVGLAKDLGISHIGLIGNKLRDADDERNVMALCEAAGVKLAAAIAYDDAVRQADRRGAALYDDAPQSITVCALEDLVNQLEKQFELLPAQTPTPLPQSAPAPTLSNDFNIAAQSPDAKRKRFPECN